MGKTILYVFFGLVLAASVNAQALTIKNHSIDWISTLGLNKEQQQQISQLEQSFRKKHQTLHDQKESCISKEHFEAVAHSLREQFFTAMQQVLTIEQRQLANQITRQQHRKMQARHAYHLAQELSLSTEQEQALVEVVRMMNFQYQWPINILQRQQSQQELENSMQYLLTDEQKDLWKKKQSKAANRNWHHYQEFDSWCRQPTFE